MSANLCQLPKKKIRILLLVSDKNDKLNKT